MVNTGFNEFSGEKGIAKFSETKLARPDWASFVKDLGGDPQEIEKYTSYKIGNTLRIRKL